MILEQWKRDGETMYQRWWNNGKMMVEQLNRDSGTVEQ